MRIFAQGWINGFDGPGRRFVYYLKGCNFRCLWCGNPESIAAEPEMLFYPEKSEFAAQSCPFGAVAGNHLNRKPCQDCSEKPCVNWWHDRAFELAGREISTAEIVAEVCSRRAMFGTDGGVTFSGGEPTLQMDALLEAARALKTRGIHLTLENNASSPRFAELADVFDLLICDLKAVTPELHRQMTGADNRTVLENLLTAPPKVIRIPLIKELNFTPSEQDAILNFLIKAKPIRVELLRLHQLGLPKYEALERECGATALRPPERGEAENFAERLQTQKIMTQVLN